MSRYGSTSKGYAHTARTVIPVSVGGGPDYTIGTPTVDPAPYPLVGDSQGVLVYGTDAGGLVQVGQQYPCRVIFSTPYAVPPSVTVTAAAKGAGDSVQPGTQAWLHGPTTTTHFDFVYSGPIGLPSSIWGFVYYGVTPLGQ